jgi:GDP-L-fucose synthase
LKVLVTGATGFLGRHLTPKLDNLGWDIYFSNTRTANLNNINNLDVFKNIKFDYIFHLAAVTKAGDYCLKHPGDQWLKNQIINTNILAYWVEKQPQAKMICMGTSCSYTPDIFMTEDNYLSGEPEPSLYTYAMTKRMLLLGLQSIQKEFGLKWLYFVPSTLYGSDFELDDNHFIFDFIRNCYNAKYNEQDFVIWGNGNQRRELIYVDDAVSAMINLLSEENQVFNLGSGTDHSINEFAEKICKCYNYDYNLVKRDLSKYVGVKEKKIDTAKVLKHLGDKGFLNTSLDEGLEKSVNYFITAMEKIND